jgi:competence protein ComEC
MTSASVIVICLAYIVGLLMTAVPYGGYGVLGLGVTIAAILSLPLPVRFRNLRNNVKPAIWLTAGAIGLVASFYLQWRTPTPAPDDISQFLSLVNPENQAQVATVSGKVLATNGLTRSEKVRLWLKPTHLQIVVAEKEINDERNSSVDSYCSIAEEVSVEEPDTKLLKYDCQVSGKLYVTVPLLQGTARYPGQLLTVTGQLYEPKAAANPPGAFDFKAYLAKEGCFAGLAGRYITASESGGQESWGMWQIRRRIVKSQARWLGVPHGPLVSAMVLGRRAVDLPFDIRDEFIQVGLAHVLAASGFHVAIILSLVQVLTSGFSDRLKLGNGTTVLIAYVCLTGGSASVWRAAFMGFAALLAPVMQRRVNSLGCLLLAAFVLLLINPLWIWDLGFQLSFLATLGLLVTSPALMKRLDWLPTAIASLIAVPIAATIWVLPLLLYVFSQISTYSILANIITSFLISWIIIGGFISAVLGAVWPLAGSAIAWLLYYPVELLILIVRFFSRLPGSLISTGTLSLVQMLIIYGLIIFLWSVPWWHKGRRWVWAFLFAIALLVVPVWHRQTTVFQVTALQTNGQPVLVIQDRGKVTLINSGDQNTARYTILPFLRQQAINQIDWGIATSSPGSRSGWYLIMEQVKVRNFASPGTLNATLTSVVQDRNVSYQVLPVGKILPAAGSTSVKLFQEQPAVVEFTIGNQSWLWLEERNQSEQSQLLQYKSLPGTQVKPLQVLWWSGEPLKADLLMALKPEAAIATRENIDEETAAILAEANISIYSTERDGALQWKPDSGFVSASENTDGSDSFF